MSTNIQHKRWHDIFTFTIYIYIINLMCTYFRLWALLITGVISATANSPSIILPSNKGRSSCSPLRADNIESNVSSVLSSLSPYIFCLNLTYLLQRIFEWFYEHMNVALWPHVRCVRVAGGFDWMVIQTAPEIRHILLRPPSDLDTCKVHDKRFKS